MTLVQFTKKPTKTKNNNCERRLTRMLTMEKQSQSPCIQIVRVKPEVSAFCSDIVF